MLFLVGAGVLWLFLCALVGVLAGSWNRSAILHFFISAVVSPILGFVLVLALGKKRSSSQSDQLKLECPKCDTVMEPTVDYCPGCGSEVVGMSK